MEYTKPKYKTGKVHEYVARKLQAFVEACERGESPRLMLFMPPQEGKSELVSRKLTPWVLGKHPEWRVVLASYGASLAEKMSKFARNTIEDQKYALLFPNTKLDPSSTAVSDWGIQGTEGGMLAIGVGGGITGNSAEILIVDDPVKGREEVDSDNYRESQWDWWPQAHDRVQEGGGIIVLCTRWHHDDLPGRLLKLAEENPNADQWEVIRLPAIAEDDDPLGRQPGEPLGGRHSLEWFLREEANISARDWNAKFQQRPTPDEGSLFLADWMRYEDPPAVPNGLVFQGADTAFSEKKQAAYTCVETWCIEQNAYRLLDVYRARVGFPSLNTDIRALADTFNPIAVVIENKASGQSLLQVLSAETRLPVLPWEPKGDKITRAHAVTPLFKAKKIILPKPENAPWVKQWVKEHLEFPATAYKDQVDTTSLSLLWAMEQSFRLAPTTQTVHEMSWDKDMGKVSTGRRTPEDAAYEAIADVQNRRSVVCTQTEYRRSVRLALVVQARHWAEDGHSIQAQLALAEVSRLDNLHAWS